MEHKNNTIKKQEEVLDYIDSFLVIHILTGREINKNVQKANNHTICTTYYFDRDCPMNSVRVFLHGLEEDFHRDSLHLSIGNWVFNGTQMRKQLIDAGIKKYRKSRTRDGHHYRFELTSSEQVQTIFEVFKNYLPK